MDDIISKPPAGLIRDIRELMPTRALSLNEAYQLAERQATELLKRLRITHPHVPMRWQGYSRGDLVELQGDDG